MATVDFGDGKEVDFYQLDASSFNERCKSGGEDDSTGLRIHPGAHVLIRFLNSSFCQTVCKNRVIWELGCGTGITSVGVALHTEPRLLVCTDGNKDAIEICRLNCSQICGNKAVDMVCEQMYWSVEEVSRVEAVIIDSSSCSSASTSTIGRGRGQSKADVVIGSELFYYLTDSIALVRTVDELLRSTDALADSDPSSSTPPPLQPQAGEEGEGEGDGGGDGRKEVDPKEKRKEKEQEHGLFISAHIFRKDGQELEFLAALHEIRPSFEVYSVPHTSFIQEVELTRNPSWSPVRCLVVGRKEDIEHYQGLAKGCSSGDSDLMFHWPTLREVLELEQKEEEEEGNVFNISL